MERVPKSKEVRVLAHRRHVSRTCTATTSSSCVPGGKMLCFMQPSLPPDPIISTRNRDKSHARGNFHQRSHGGPAGTPARPGSVRSAVWPAAPHCGDAPCWTVGGLSGRFRAAARTLGPRGPGILPELVTQRQTPALGPFRPALAS